MKGEVSALAVVSRLYDSVVWYRNEVIIPENTKIFFSLLLSYF